MQYEIIPVTTFAQNCSLLWCEATRHAAVIDPGGDLDKVLARVDALQLELGQILLTHAHIDHAGGAGELACRYDIPIVGPHQADRFWIDALTEQSRMFGFPPAQTFEPSRWLEQGDLVQVGEFSLEVLHCPGHTPGHVVFYHSMQQLLFVGDVIFQGSIGRTDFPQGDHATLLASIRQQLLSLPDSVRFIPGHGPMSEIGFEKRYNPFLQ
jgi:glyoxylase-like metal-dependent hydrolase (beta-lactamase superfamily II)